MKRLDFLTPYAKFLALRHLLIALLRGTVQHSIKFGIENMKVLLVLAAVVGTGMVISGCAKKEVKEEPAQVGTPTPTPKPKPKTEATTVEFTPPSTTDTPSFSDMPSPTPQAPVERNYRYGVRTDREGFVRSPDAPDQGLIDVRGFPPGSEVKDPYTGNVFLVP